MERSAASRRPGWLVLFFGVALIVMALFLAVVEFVVRQDLLAVWLLLAGLVVFVVGARIKGARA